MKYKILLGGIITSIFLTFFSVNVMASEEDTTTGKLTVVDVTEELNYITTEYDNYVVFQHDNIYNVYANISYDTDKGIQMGYTTSVYRKERLTSIEEVKDALENSSLELYENMYFSKHSVINNIIYSSHDVYYLSELAFQQAPLLEIAGGTQSTVTVGGMKSQQIVTETTKQMVGLVPCMIVSLVGYLAFRKGLVTLLQVLAKA